MPGEVVRSATGALFLRISQLRKYAQDRGCAFYCQGSVVIFRHWYIDDPPWGRLAVMGMEIHGLTRLVGEEGYGEAGG